MLWFWAQTNRHPLLGSCLYGEVCYIHSWADVNFSLPDIIIETKIRQNALVDLP